MPFSVGIHLELQHDLFGNVVRHHAFCGAFCGKLGQIPVRRILPDVVLLQHINEFRERGSDIHTRFVLDTLDSLAEYFFDDERKVVLEHRILCFIQIHEHRDEGA